MIRTAERVVFLFDVDDTLLDNDTAQNDYLDHIARHLGPHAAQRYWTIFRGLYDVLGYADYLGALQLCRLEDRHDRRLPLLSSYLLDYTPRDLTGTSQGRAVSGRNLKDGPLVPR